MISSPKTRLCETGSSGLTAEQIFFRLARIVRGVIHAIRDAASEKAAEQALWVDCNSATYEANTPNLQLRPPTHTLRGWFTYEANASYELRGCLSTGCKPAACDHTRKPQQESGDRECLLVHLERAPRADSWALGIDKLPSVGTPAASCGRCSQKHGLSSASEKKRGGRRSASRLPG